MPFSTPLRPAGAAVTICRKCKLPLQRQPFLRANSTTPERIPSFANPAGQTSDDNADTPPRWARVPPQMRAPYRTRPKSDNDEYPCNEDPRKLNDAYVKMLGKDGYDMLPEEVRWLAVTHKSFDHGRRGFNDRLAFLGKRIVELQTSLALLDSPRPAYEVDAKEGKGKEDRYGRVPFEHPALEKVNNMAPHVKDQLLQKQRLAQLAASYGLDAVIRWKPKQVKSLQSSGVDTVLAHTLYAIVGAVALQKGGEIANQIVRLRILNPLGIK